MRIWIAVLVCAAMAVTGHAQAKKPEAYYITAAKLKVRLGANKSAPVTNTLSRRQKVEVYEVENGWARISKYYDGSAEGVSGKVARWVSAQYISKNRPPEIVQPVISKDPRIKGIPKVGEYGTTKRDVEILYAAAAYYLKTGKCKRIEYGDKSASKPNTYYLNFGGNTDHFFKPSDIPGLKKKK